MEVNLNYIQSLASHKEGVDVEFKETTGQLNRGMETLCGMLNGAGGIVVFGVSNSGKIIGQEIGDKTTREIGEALIKFDPAVEIEPNYIELGNGKSLIAFVCNEGDPNKPYMWDGKPYQRLDSVTAIMPREMFLRLHEAQRGLTYPWEKENAIGKGDLDEALITNIVQGAIRRGRLSQSAANDTIPTTLKRLKLTANGVLCNAGVVLFGKNFFDYPQCMLRLARFKGTIKRDFIDNQQVEGNIFELVDAAMSFFFKHLSLSGTTHGLTQRQDELEVPYDALREAVVNAFCHRAWQKASSTVGISIYDDRIEIENAGRFPANLSPIRLSREEQDNDDNTSLPPNPIIANVMFLAGLIEHWGRGLSLMNTECERAGLPTPIITDNGFSVKVVFKRQAEKSEQKNSGQSTVEVQQKNSRSTVGVQLSAGLKRLISTIGEDWYSATELRELLGFKSKGTFFKNYITPAIDKGLIRLEDPKNPNSPKQRYGLTLEGKAVYYGKQ